MLAAPPSGTGHICASSSQAGLPLTGLLGLPLRNPDALATTGAETTSGIIPGPNTDVHIYHEHLLADFVGMPLHGFGLRLSKSKAGAALPNSPVIMSSFEVRLGPAAAGVSPTNASSVRLADIYSSLTTVRNATQLTVAAGCFPAYTPGTLEGFTYFGFDTPYTYAGGHLVVLLRHYPGPGSGIPTGTPAYIDAYNDTSLAAGRRLAAQFMDAELTNQTSLQTLPAPFIAFLSPPLQHPSELIVVLCAMPYCAMLLRCNTSYLSSPLISILTSVGACFASQTAVHTLSVIP